MILILFASFATLAEVAQAKEADPQGDTGCATVHFIAARYVQWRIVAEIEKSMGSSCRDKSIPHNEIAAAAYQIFAYDVGFCLYFFVFVGCFGFNCWEMSQFGECEADTGPGWAAAMGMILFHVGVWNYFFCWYCMQVCCGRAQKKKQGGPAAVTMGQM